MKFKLRTLLLFVLVVAVGITAYPYARNYLLWHRVRGEVEAWAANVSRIDGAVDPFVHVDYFGNTFAVSTAEPYQEGRNRKPKNRQRWWAINTPTPHDPNRFFVMPPGKWVNNADEIVDAWAAND